jgi:hypothetical protein
MADKPHGSSATEAATDAPLEDGASGVYVVNVIWRSGLIYGSEASESVVEERTTSRTVSANTARAVLRMLDEDTGDEPVVR